RRVPLFCHERYCRPARSLRGAFAGFIRDSPIASVAARRRRVARALPALTAPAATAPRSARRAFRRVPLADLLVRVPATVLPLVFRARNIVCLPRPCRA